MRHSFDVRYVVGDGFWLNCVTCRTRERVHTKSQGVAFSVIDRAMKNHRAGIPVSEAA